VPKTKHGSEREDKKEPWSLKEGHTTGTVPASGPLSLVPSPEGSLPITADTAERHASVAACDLSNVAVDRRERVDPGHHLFVGGCAIAGKRLKMTVERETAEQEACSDASDR